MTRFKPGHKIESRRKMVEAAEKKIRENGFSGVGVDALAAAAGLTSGAFYKQFRSKTEILVEILRCGLAQTANRIKEYRLESPKKWRKSLFENYFSAAHRENAGEGCALPSLAIDAARVGEETQQVFEDGFNGLVEELEAGFAGEQGEKAAGKKRVGSKDINPRERALIALALMTGGITLARAVPDGKTADEILSACRKFMSGD